MKSFIRIVFCLVIISPNVLSAQEADTANLKVNVELDSTVSTKNGAIITLDEVQETATDAVEQAAKEVEDENNSALTLLRDGKANTQNVFDPYDTLRLYTEGFEGFEILDDVVNEYDVFLIGENHTYSKSNAKLWLKSIKYLNQYAGVRNIIFEYGASYGFLVNEYMKTRDTALFNAITRFVYPPYSEAIKELAIYNATLPDSAKLYFSGIDIDRGVYPILKALDYLLPDDISSVPDSVNLHLQSIRSLSEYNKTKLLELEPGEPNYYGFTYKTNGTLELVHQNFKNNETIYQELLGNNFEQFRAIIIEQYKERKLWEKYAELESVQKYIYRETQMYRRFEQEYAAHDGAWFGQFGRCHTIKREVNNNSCEWYLFNSLADRMQTSTSDMRVMTIAQIYPQDELFGSEHEDDAALLAPYVDQLASGSMTLFDLASDTAIQQAFGDDFDFMVFNNNSSTPSGVNYWEYEESEDESTVAYAIGYGQHDFDISGITDLYSDTLESSFSSPLQAITFHTNWSDERYFGSLVIGSYIAQEIREYNKDYTLSGNFFKFSSGYDLSKGPTLAIAPMIGFSANTLSLEIREEREIGISDAGIGGLRIVEFRNPSFAFDFDLLAQINVGGFTFGANAGYVLDVSNKKWRTGDELIESGPSTSFNGLRWTTWVGWSF